MRQWGIYQEECLQREEAGEVCGRSRREGGETREGGEGGQDEEVEEGNVYNRDKYSFSDADCDKVWYSYQCRGRYIVWKAQSEVEEKIYDAMETATAAGEEMTG